MTTPQLSHPMRRTIPSPAAVAITLSWTVFTLTPSFAVAETPETTVRPGTTSPEAMYRETPGVHTPAGSPATTVPADTAQLLFRAAASTGEGAIWHPGRRSLLWVDIEGKTLHEYVPTAFGKVSCGTGELMSGTKPAGSDTLRTVMTVPSVTRRWTFDRMVSTVVPETDSTVIVAVQNRVERIDLNSDTREVLARIDDRNGSVRTNDGKCDPAGRLWLGTMAFAGTPGAGTLYCLDPTGIPAGTRDLSGPAGQNTSGPTARYAAGQTREPASGTTTQNPPEPAGPNGILRTSAPLIPSVKLGSVTISNGIVWSADRRTMYYVDTPTRRVSRYRYDDSTGAIAYEGIAVQIPEEMGFPDGMTIDRCGNLWIALWGGYGVGCWNPHSGELLHRIFVPCPNAASCAFGGENLDTLYITTAGGTPDSRLRQDYPLSGSLFVCKPGVYGVKACFFYKKN